MQLFRACFTLLSFILALSAGAQSILSRVTFPLDDQQTIRDLAEAGLDITHGHGDRRSTFTTDLEDYQLARLDALGIRYHIEIPDMTFHRHTKEKVTHHHFRGTDDCRDRVFDHKQPVNFKLGQVGGFYSLPEVLDNLDAMRNAYPHLISVRKAIGTIKTHQNNNIFYVKISDNPNLDEDEPKVLYTGLHHAREFISISEMIYYMWYLLENYSQNPLVKQIVDQTELFFVPVVNPDGLEYNVAGYQPQNDVFTRYHRKNMRDNNGNGVFDFDFDGVDLNRNYGHAWGFNNEGSSPYQGSETYRGPFAFSEPETQAIQLLCNTYNFKIALNAHSYGNFLVYPWGFSDQPTTDSIAFSNYGELLTRANHFVYGRGVETVGYSTNGDSDDWMYGVKGILSMTPEIGDDFYPAKEEIIPLCQSMLDLNLKAARLVNSLIHIVDESPDYIRPGINTLNLNFTRYGLLNGEVVVSFKSLSPYVQDLPGPVSLNLDIFESAYHALTFFADNNLPEGSAAKIEITIQQGGYTFKDTLTKYRSDFSNIVVSDVDMSQWNYAEGTSWGTTTSTFKVGPTCITDSPNGLYSPAAREILLLDREIDLRNDADAYIQFWAKWDIQDLTDYVTFQVSDDGRNWEHLCGEYTGLGSIFQAFNQPLYDGKQEHWVLERVDLNAYIGKIIQVRFMLISDGFEQRDGFYFDNFSIITSRTGVVSTQDIPDADVTVFPNPTQSAFTISWGEAVIAPSLTIYDATGRIMYTERRIPGEAQRVTTAQWADGLYFYNLYNEYGVLHSGAIQILR